VVFAHGSGSSRHSPRNRFVASALNASGLGTLLFDLLSPDEELDRTQVFSILTRFAPGLAARERGFLHDQHTPTMFAVRDLVKDLDLALEEYESSGSHMPVTGQARQLFAATMRQSPDLDISAIVRLGDAVESPPR